MMQRGKNEGFLREIKSTLDYHMVAGKDDAGKDDEHEDIQSSIQYFQYFVLIEVNGYELKALIDYTASHSSISKNAAKDCGLLREEGDQCGAFVKVGTTECHLVVRVIDRPSPIFLLGLDILRGHQCSLDFENNLLLSGKEVGVPLLQELNVPKSRGFIQELPIFKPKMSKLWAELYDEQRKEWHLPLASCNEKVLERQMQMIQGEITEVDQTLRHLEASLHVLVPTSLYIQTVIFGLPSGALPWVAVLIAWLIVAVIFIVIILNKAIDWRERTVRVQILRGHLWCRKYALGLTVSSCPIYEIGIPHRHGIAGAIYVCLACIMLVAPALFFLYLQLSR